MEQATADFNQFIGTMYQHGCIMQSVALGHDLGLFKVICEATEAISLQEIADKLDLKERYTKEWLSGMVAAGMILQDKDTNLYSVPDAHKPALTNNTAFSCMMVHMGKRADALRKCFKKDGPWGIPFQVNPEFFDWMHEIKLNKSDEIVNKMIVPQFEKMTGLLQKLETGIKVVDIGCGTGLFANSLAKRFPNSNFIGLDSSEKAIGLSNDIRESREITNVSFVHGDAHNLPDEWRDSIGLVLMYNALHDLPDPHKCLTEVHRVLQDGGCLTVVEIDIHSNPAENANNKMAAQLYSMSTFICIPASMSEEPRAGKGACWGVEDMTKAFEDGNFTVALQCKSSPKGHDSYFFCTK